VSITSLAPMVLSTRAGNPLRKRVGVPKVDERNRRDEQENDKKYCEISSLIDNSTCLHYMLSRVIGSHRSDARANGGQLNIVTIAILLLSLITLCGCEELVRDASSLLIPKFSRSEIIGFLAGLGTTFAGVPDLVAMLRRRSSAGVNPRMAAIMGVFQILWVYYGLLIVSRPVVVWNVVALGINFLTVAEYFRFARKERNRAKE